MSEKHYQSDVVIAGAGLAGIVTAFELIERGVKVLLIDKDSRENWGGLAKLSFGGVCLIGTPHQKRLGIEDTPELALRDWHSFADFGDDEDYEWGRKWAKFYCENSLDYIYKFLSDRQVSFLPVVNWVERGVFRPGNSVPRWHIAWGTGHEIAVRSIAGLDEHARRSSLDLLFDHEVSDIEIENGRAVGVVGKNMLDGQSFRASAGTVVIASGGICGGDLSKVRENWFEKWGEAPKTILNGAHDYADGLLHDRAAAAGAKVTHLDKHWHYAAGVHRGGQRRPNDGISLVPPRSALWMNAEGRRIGPMPLVGYADTRDMVEKICQEPGQYSWQVLNRTIALKELAVSGCDFMTAFRFKKRLMLLKHLLFGNKELVDRLINECPDDFVVANSVEELAEKMEQKSLYGLKIDREGMAADIRDYDAQIDRGPQFFTDDQLRRIAIFRRYRGDRIRLCKFQKIVDSRAMPLIAIREFILARKSLGGIQSDLDCRVLKGDGSYIPGLYAVGEAAGFGGGGIHGHGSLEGTFLGSCVLTGRVAGKKIAAA